MSVADRFLPIPTVLGGTVRRAVSRPVLAGRVATLVDGAHFLDVPASALVIAVNDAGALGESVLAAALPARWARRMRMVRDVGAGEAAVRCGLAAVVVDDAGTAASIARATGVPLVPLGITGGVAAMPPGHRVPVGGRPRVVARAGRPLGHPGGIADVTASAVAAAVSRLLAEERLGWYGALLADTRSSAGSASVGAGAATSWRTRWLATEPVDRRTRRAVWVTRR